MVSGTRTVYLNRLNKCRLPGDLPDDGRGAQWLKPCDNNYYSDNSLNKNSIKCKKCYLNTNNHAIRLI